MRLAGTAFAALIVSLTLATEARADRWHTVAPHQSLRAVAKRYGCTVGEMKQANQLDGDRINAGERLIIPECDDEDRPKKVEFVTGQSIGRPWRGRLTNPARLADGRGYHIRRAYRTYGATHVVGYITRALTEAHKKFPKAHVLAVGDISEKHGGQISDHHSHQTGRDIDVGFFYNKKPAGYPDAFVTASADNLDCEKTLGLIERFAASRSKPGGVKMIFLDFNVQGILVRWARKHGWDDDKLEAMFQFPHGRGSSEGLVRHEPNHADHFHVRYNCAPGDDHCE
jgi:murein endopeptidase